MTEEQRQRYKARYKGDADFRQRVLGNAAKWREDNRDYDMGRKTIEGWRLTDEQKRRKTKVRKARLKDLNSRICLLACAWDKKQRLDPELGDYYRVWHRKGISPDERAAARAKYDAMMAQRRFDRRRERIEVLMSSCTEKQRTRLMAKLEAFDRAQDSKSGIEANTKHRKTTNKKGAKQS